MTLASNGPGAEPSRLNNVKGVAWACLATGLFAFVFVSGKLADGAATALQIMWLRYVGGLLVVGAAIAIHPRRAELLQTSRLSMHAIRAGCGGFGGAAAVYAAANMPVAQATAIGLLDGLFTVAMGVVLLRESISPRQVAAGALCFAGALLAVSWGAGLSPDGLPIIPASVALLGALLIAAEAILIKTLARRERAATVLFYVNLFGAVILLGPALWSWSAVSPWLVAGFLLLGPLAIAAQIFNIWAFRAADAAVVGPVRYTWIVYGAVFGLVIFGERPDVGTLLGAAMILIGGVMLATSRAQARAVGDHVPKRRGIAFEK